jgi:hypothetical protein
LPQPDSPTTPTHSPSETLKETSSTAWTVAERSRNSVWSPSTSSTVFEGMLSKAGAAIPQL